MNTEGKTLENQYDEKQWLRLCSNPEFVRARDAGDIIKAGAIAAIIIKGYDVSFGQGETQRRAVDGFVFGLNYFLGLMPIRGPQTFSLPRLGVETVKLGAAFAQPVSFFHDCLSR
jgi:hypothetical protein